MLGLGLGLNKNIKSMKNIVKNGLVLWLDGKDFSNSPPTSLWMDKAKPNPVSIYTNLVSNGDFENDSNADGLADGYILYSGGNATYTMDSSVYHSGTKSQKIIATSPYNQFGIIINKTGLIVGHKYYITYYSMLGASNTGAITNNIYVDGTSIVASNAYTNNTKGVWNRQSAILTALQTSGYIYIRTTGTSVIGDTMYLDSAMLVDLTALYGTGLEPPTLWCDANLIFTTTTNTINTNAITYTNLILNGDFSLDSNSDGQADSWGSPSNKTALSMNNNTQTFTPTTQYGGLIQTKTTIIGHKYYFTALVNARTGVIFQCADGANYPSALVTVNGSFQKLSFVYTVTTANVSVAIQDNNTSGFSPIQVQQVMMLDLSEIFGVGLEPTPSECNSLFAFTSVSSKNEVNYNPNTWAEWILPTYAINSGSTKDISGVNLIADGTNFIQFTRPTNVKNSTKYGILYNVVSSTLTKGLSAGGYANDAFQGISLSSNVGNNKSVCTTPTSIYNNRIMPQVSNTEPSGNQIKLKDFRVFELPVGSQIETDFTNLSADALNTKYPLIPNPVAIRGNNAIPSGMAYTTASGSDGVGGVVFDGVDDYCNTSITQSIFTNKITLEAYINQFGGSSQNIIFNANSIQTSCSLYVRHSAGFDVAFTFNYGSTKYYLYGGTLDYSKSAHIIATFDGTTICIYINGVLASTGVGTSAQATNWSTLTIGKASDGLTTFNGKIKSCRIYNRVLTSSEVLQNYNASK